MAHPRGDHGENSERWRWFSALCDGDEITTVYEWAVVSALYRRMNRGGCCWPARATLAADSRTSVPTVNKVTDKLASLGWLRIERSRSRKPHTYFAQIPDRIPQPAAEESNDEERLLRLLRSPVEVVA